MLTRLQDILVELLLNSATCYMDKKYAISEGYTCFEDYFVGEFIICVQLLWIWCGTTGIDAPAAPPTNAVTMAASAKNLYDKHLLAWADKGNG